jgi:hypothetical protein
MTNLELQYKVRAISAALDSWNDVEVLRLVRSSWPHIKNALAEKTVSSADADHADAALPRHDANARMNGSAMRSHGLPSSTPPSDQRRPERDRLPMPLPAAAPKEAISTSRARNVYEHFTSGSKASV